MSNDHVLVTGATGLIGNAVRRRLEDRGTSVIAIDRVATSVSGRKVLECDVTDIHGLHSIARRFPIRGIVHCGAFSWADGLARPSYPDDPGEYRRRGEHRRTRTA